MVSGIPTTLILKMAKQDHKAVSHNPKTPDNPAFLSF